MCDIIKLPTLLGWQFNYMEDFMKKKLGLFGLILIVVVLIAFLIIKILLTPVAKPPKIITPEYSDIFP